MTPSRLRTPDLVLGFFAAALVISLWSTWYSVAIVEPGGHVAVSGSGSGWESLSTLDVFLVLTAAMVGLYLVLVMVFEAAAIPLTVLVLATTAGLVSAVWVFVRLFVMPESNIGLLSGVPVETSLEPGIFLALIGAAGIFASGIWAMRNETSPGVPPQPEPELLETPAP